MFQIVIPLHEHSEKCAQSDIPNGVISTYGSYEVEFDVDHKIEHVRLQDQYTCNSGFMFLIVKFYRPFLPENDNFKWNSIYLKAVCRRVNFLPYNLYIQLQILLFHNPYLSKK